MDESSCYQSNREKNILDKYIPRESDDYTSYMTKLKQAAIGGVVVKGLKETLKAIESDKAEVVFLAQDCELEDYKKLIIDYCNIHSKTLVDVKAWTELRDILIDGIPSSMVLENARKKGKVAKISPKCYSAAIVEF